MRCALEFSLSPVVAALGFIITISSLTPKRPRNTKRDVQSGVRPRPPARLVDRREVVWKIAHGGSGRGRGRGRCPVKHSTLARSSHPHPRQAEPLPSSRAREENVPSITPRRVVSVGKEDEEEENQNRSFFRRGQITIAACRRTRR